MIPIQTLSVEKFEKYGKILEPTDKTKVFTVLCGEEEKVGWRIGYVILQPEDVKRLEAHPESLETFEPVRGVSIFLAAPADDPDNIEAFLLDKSVLVNKNIWHGVKVISETAEIKVTENFEVDSIYHELKEPIDVGFVKV